MTWQVTLGDCLAELRQLPDASIDAIVTDPPAGIEFMGKDWDTFKDDPNSQAFGDTFATHGYSDGGQRLAAPAQKLSNRNPMCRKCHKHIRGAGGCVCEVPDPDEDAEFVHRAKLRQRDAFISYLRAIMEEARRVLKPGGHALVWALPRTSHWTGTAIEEAGFEIRDCIFHFFGSGFPKSLDVGKALDRAAGAERAVVGRRVFADGTQARKTAGVSHEVLGEFAGDPVLTAPATPEAVQWDGWGTALKPAVECWWLARKPLEGTVAANVLKYGTGAINIDGCRVTTTENLNGGAYSGGKRSPVSGDERTSQAAGLYGEDGRLDPEDFVQPSGRWPAHLVLSHMPECRCVGTRRVEATSIHGEAAAVRRSGVHSEAGGHQALGRVQPVRGYADADGKETVEAWECSPNCPVRMLNEQSGMSSGTGGVTSGATALGQGSGWNAHRNRTTEIVRQNDAGGASRFFPTFEEEETPLRAPQSDPAKRQGVVGKDMGFSKGTPEKMHAAQAASTERMAALGRWPAHLVLSHTPECRCVGTKRVKGITGGFTPGSTGAFGQHHTYGQAEGAEHTPQYADADGMEEIEAWECAPDCPVKLLDDQAGDLTVCGGPKKTHGSGGLYEMGSAGAPGTVYADSGGPSRFFYVAKPARSERNIGGVENKHPTVKALGLMRWLVRMITPPGGTVLDPFTGSGSTGCAAVLEGCQFIGFEREAEYLEVAKARIAYCAAHPEEFAPKPKKPKLARPHGRPVPKPVPAAAPAPAGDVNSWLNGIMVAVKG